ncbi:MAG: hypothetical protein ACYDAQ_20010 [Mycobacteriales bacterium]
MARWSGEVAVRSALARPLDSVPLTVAIGVTGAALLTAAGPYGPLGLVGLAGFVGMVVAVRRSPHVLAPMVVVGFALQPALKFFVSVLFGPAKDAVVLLGATALVVDLAARRRHGRALRAAGVLAPDAWVVSGVVLLMLLYLINPAGAHDTAWADAARLTIEAFLLFLMGYLAPDPRRVWRWASVSLLVTGVFETLVGLWEQYEGVTRLVVGYGYAYGEQVRQTAGGSLRSFGTFDDPFNYATFMLVAFAVASTRKLSPRTFALLATLGLGVAVSYDRTDISLVAIVLALMLVRRSKGTAAGPFLAALAVAGLVILGLEHAPTHAGSAHSTSFLLSLNGRTKAWGDLFRHPARLIAGQGVGAHGTGLARSQYGLIAPVNHYQAGKSVAAASNANLTSIDSSYLALLDDVGLPGLLLLVGVVWRGGWLLSRARQSSSPVVWATIGAGLVTLLDAVTRTSLTEFPFGFIALYLLGAGLAASELELAAPPRRPPRLGVPRRPARRLPTLRRPARAPARAPAGAAPPGPPPPGPPPPARRPPIGAGPRRPAPGAGRRRRSGPGWWSGCSAWCSSCSSSAATAGPRSRPTTTCWSSPPPLA